MGERDRYEGRLERLDAWRWRIPRHGAMRVDGLVYADDQMMVQGRHDSSLGQVVDVASLPGIVGRSLAMPDFHHGYGFPIGGVAAFDVNEGVVSPGGVGYDINCGVRLMRTSLDRAALEGRLEDLANGLFAAIPSGVGARRPDLRLSRKELRGVLLGGAAWAARRGFGDAGDLAHVEDGGRMGGADAEAVSEAAQERGLDQLGTLGSGNHFVEVQYVDEVFDGPAARAFGLEAGALAVCIHSGSRGLGHQVCEDYLQIMATATRRYGLALPDRQLCCAPVGSPEGRRYLGAMAAAANYAFANRHVMGHAVRDVLEQVLGVSPRELGLGLVYDVCHNVATFERHAGKDGAERLLCVHRKGATRAFPAGHRDVPADYRAVGQPVLVPGDMGRCSYVLVGTEAALAETFGSCCHGAGRRLSRQQAQRQARGRSIAQELGRQGVVVRAEDRRTLAEEMPEAYKDVSSVVGVLVGAGLCRAVARLKPLAVIKG